MGLRLGQCLQAFALVDEAGHDLAEPLVLSIPDSGGSVAAVLVDRAIDLHQTVGDIVGGHELFGVNLGVVQFTNDRVDYDPFELGQEDLRDRVAVLAVLRAPVDRLIRLVARTRACVPVEPLTAVAAPGEVLQEVGFGDRLLGAVAEELRLLGLVGHRQQRLVLLLSGQGLGELDRHAVLAADHAALVHRVAQQGRAGQEPVDRVLLPERPTERRRCLPVVELAANPPDRPPVEAPGDHLAHHRQLLRVGFDQEGMVSLPDRPVAVSETTAHVAALTTGLGPHIGRALGGHHPLPLGADAHHIGEHHPRRRGRVEHVVRGSDHLPVLFRPVEELREVTDGPRVPVELPGA